MAALTKLEVGKTYVFKDEESREGYIISSRDNEDYYSSYYKDGFTLDEVDCGDGYQDGCMVIEDIEIQYFKEKIMPIKPEDEVTITTTYGDLARVYAVLGKTNGWYSPTKNGLTLWCKLKEILDPYTTAHKSFLYEKSGVEVLDYNTYQAEWERLLFPQKPLETEQQKQIRELREQAEELLAKAKKLEGVI